MVFAPHWYPDIYPYLGFNVAPRAFTPEQVRFRDYGPNLRGAAALSTYSMGNVPVVFGEFGTYFNFNGIKDARASGYEVSAQILDNYYEAFERDVPEPDALVLLARERLRDGRRLEPRGLLDRRPGTLAPRGELAWSRPHARALAGKPISTHFYSDYHYFDPDKGVAPPEREFEVRYAEPGDRPRPPRSSCPTVQYPDGFYVWVSDGLVHFDPERSVLYHLPERDEPGFEHWVRLRPPLSGSLNDGLAVLLQGRQGDGAGGTGHDAAHPARPLARRGRARAPRRTFPRIEVHAELLNAVLYRSDSDFDPSPPAYDANGKSVGFVGTVLRPGLDFLALSWLRLHYDAELGLNYWSRNDPDVQSALAPGLLVMKHRQLYAEGELAAGAARLPGRATAASSVPPGCS